jgi:hypothetical protein
MNVVDERGKQVTYLGGLSYVLEQPFDLGPGQTRELQTFDLAVSYYLRRPGRYTARFPGSPPSAAIEFEIVPNPILAAADGDPVGRLLPLVQEKWWLGAGASQPKLEPGANWGEVPGRTVNFVFNPPQHKNDSGMILICLADEAAPALPPASYFSSSKPGSQYWGKISRWHVYVTASAIALHAWPTAKEDIIKALSAEAEAPADRLERQGGSVATPPEEAARFVAAAKQAFENRDVEALMALTCWDRVPDKLKESGRKHYVRDIAHNATDIVLISPDPMYPDHMWNDKDGVSYRSNLPVVKQLKITFSPGTTIDTKIGAIGVSHAHYPVGEKEGKLYLLAPAPVK